MGARRGSAQGAAALTKRKRKRQRHTITPAAARAQLHDAQELEPGVWIDREGALHFSVPDILKARGIPVTPEAIADATEKLHDAAAAMNPGAEIVIRDLQLGGEPMTTRNAAAAGNGQPVEVQTWWLSFNAGDRFVGVAVVDVTAADVDEAMVDVTRMLAERAIAPPTADEPRWIAGAMLVAGRHGCFPGGGVGATRIDVLPSFETMGPLYPRNRLLSKAELEAIAPVAEVGIPHVETPPGAVH